MPDSTGEQLKERIRQAATALGFHRVGFASLQSPPDLSGLQSWLAAGYQADMQWMNHPKRSDPAQILPGAASMIVVALNYYTPHAHQPNAAKISRYAWGRDYHRVLGKRLKALSQWLETELSCQTRSYVDTGPIAEKAWAMQAGIGWIGKNSLLLTRHYGSWVFLGEILTTLDLNPDPPHTSHCGTCTRCITACPTQAIVDPGVVDANRCIAYHTLESHAVEIPSEIAAHQQNWVAGCDICQDVCPWNQRFAQPTDVVEFQPYAWNLDPSLAELAEISQLEFERRTPVSALRRLKADRLRRNSRACQQSNLSSV